MKLIEITRPNSMIEAGDILHSHGYTKLGAGNFGQVWGKQDEDWVVKLFQDKAYLHFVDLAIKYPNRHFPQFKSKPRRIVGNTWGVRLEHLERANQAAANLISLASKYAYMYSNLKYFQEKIQKKNFDNFNADRNRIHIENTIRASMEGMKEFEQKYSSLSEAIRLIILELDFPLGAQLDLHEANFMLRGYTLVIVDPISDVARTKSLNYKPQQDKLPIQLPYQRKKNQPPEEAKHNYAPIEQLDFKDFLWRHENY